MFRHYLVVGLRSLAYHRLYSLINIASLSIGLAAAILIALYVRDELSYDRWIPDTENLYRLEATMHFPGRPAWPTAMASFPVVTAIAKQIPQVKAVTHVMAEPMTVILGDRQFRQTITFADPGFFRVIQLPLVAGDPVGALAEPDSVVLSQSMARKLFGATDPLGKIVTVSPDRNGTCAAADSTCLARVYALTVTAVLRDLPHNTQLVADLVVPNTSRADDMSPAEKAGDWTALDGDYGYLELRAGADPATVLAALKPVLDVSIDLHKFGVNMKGSEHQEYRLTPFTDAHLTSDQYGGMTPGGSWTTVYGLGAIAVLIILTACCNFTNLATARATLRAREIAVRKLGGARRGELIAQFLIEAVLLSVASLAIALSLVEVLLPLYDRFLGKSIELRYLTDWRQTVCLIALAVAVGLVSGFYPAVVLSAFRPAASLKAGALSYGGPGFLRSALVVTQFATSIGLGIAALVMVSQIDFARRVDLGFDREGIVVVGGVARFTPPMRENFAAALRANPQIAGAAYSNAVPFNLFSTSSDLIRTPGDPQMIPVQSINIGPGFPALYRMKLLAGRFLSDERGEDVSTRGIFHNLLINATGARRMGLSPDEAVGRRVVIAGRSGTATIVGVLSDTKLQGMREVTQPALYYFDHDDQHAMTLLSIRIRGDRPVETLSFIDRTWHSFSPSAAIDRYYLTDAFEGLFEPDQRQGEMLGFFVGIAMLIACLGLFGLAVFTAERRTKEIGVRKIAGARTFEVLRLMLWRISAPVLIANLIAWPVAYHYLARWLEGYADRITLSPFYFLLVGAAALLVAWATVFAHTLRLVRASPVHALRYE